LLCSLWFSFERNQSLDISRGLITINCYSEPLAIMISLGARLHIKDVRAQIIQDSLDLFSSFPSPEVDNGASPLIDDKR
jgi:hypothetical protein